MRYRLRYGMAEVPLDPPGRTLPMSFVEVTRFAAVWDQAPPPVRSGGLRIYGAEAVEHRPGHN